MWSRGQMMRQNYEACAVGIKMATIKGKSLAWENVGKGYVGYRYEILEDPGKGLDGGGTNVVPGRARTEIG